MSALTLAATPLKMLQKDKMLQKGGRVQSLHHIPFLSLIILVLLVYSSNKEELDLNVYHETNLIVAEEF